MGDESCERCGDQGVYGELMESGNIKEIVEVYCVHCETGRALMRAQAPGEYAEMFPLEPRCDSCNDTGTREKKIGGNGYAEADVEVYCYCEAGERLRGAA